MPRRKEPLDKVTRGRKTAKQGVSLGRVEKNSNVKKLHEAANALAERGRLTAKDEVIIEEMRLYGFPAPSLSLQEATTLNPLLVMLHRAKQYQEYRKVRINEKLIQRGLQTPTRLPRPPPEPLSYLVPAQPQCTTPSYPPLAPPQFVPSPNQPPPTSGTPFLGFQDVVASEPIRYQPGRQLPVRTPAPATPQSSHFVAPASFHTTYPTSAVHGDPETPSRRQSEPRVRRIIIVGNEVLSFFLGDIKPPVKKMKYGNFVSKIVHDWDHGNPSLLEYHGVPIPMRLWPSVLRKPFPDFWRTNTKQFSEFKLVVSVYRLYETEAHFWADFSKPEDIPGGQGSKQARLSFKAIVQKARAIRLSINEKDVRAAMEAHLVDFDEVFSYRQGNEKKVYNTPEKIASRWRMLQGLPPLWEEEVDERFLD
ncbi:hypothetical protein BU25DRAFT_489023 [Macroventuria anomochaeta]|uniref:Uncharacterized protein n=1 Tax=Macroventuria anomochaeta TaxID=301207 RepID=A0ACB6S9W1_9PLEO|nr:uncharacterized protein BU25DRAFT_489023 [Macroventuria anomochaeta]KAF2630911.1 hypothetical protein BU25DRAFT_489023 [Macroventuria anomochaeta]